MRIGVFDSGLGGLTVVRELRSLYPSVDILYLGDTARVPYGIRSDATIRQYAHDCASFLHSQRIETLVIACNTVSALALKELQQEFDFPVFGVIEPGAAEAVRSSQGAPIGVLGTLATIDSGAYVRAVQERAPALELITCPAPLLVPLVEEGWTEGEVPRQVIRRYLEPLLKQGIGSLILGCTHYPLLKDSFRRELISLGHEHVAIIDSGVALARQLKKLVESHTNTQQSMHDKPGELAIFVTDAPRRFRALAERFLDQAIGHVSIVKL
ncbi:MAG: glutamate racemase [Bdellovibrionales bacterium RIFOXYC1_FULL_54_43]|nr:MAG: glutamate racemase [Bdellovibrionales bacterium RIFOXYC1_FULL_54_43]OFZ84950.1 MAG: glutamate racemase [Bdellovibrionales bacterium RIFOXYD1_FULL_55_31]